MREAEVVKFFSIIRIEHPHFESTTEKSMLWAELMKDLPFEVALNNLYEFMKGNSRAPRAADIIRKSPDVFYNHEQLAIETEERAQQMLEWEQKACDPPLQLEEKWRAGE